MSDTYKDQFLNASKDWVCESYSIDIRYIARRVAGEFYLMGASIGVTPLPPTEDLEFCIETNEILAGQVQLSDQKKNDLLEILNKAAQGRLEANGHEFVLKSDRAYDYHSDMNYGDRWFAELHLQVIGNRDNAQNISHIDVCKIEDTLRQCTPPFDGLSDLAIWLGLKNPLQSHEAPVINIRILPPVDLIFQGCSLEEDILKLQLLAHPQFELSHLDLAIRVVPGVGIKSRMQIASDFKWKQEEKGMREGFAQIRLDKADSVLTMLLIGDITVRRQWLLDPTKSANNRLVAVQLFDKELRMIRNALFDSTDSARFELGVSALLFLMGFSPAVQVETESPDIVVATPSGRLILVECTTRIADFSAKLGKLVDRKRSLSKVLQGSKSPTRVDGILVCALPKDQIASRSDELQAHQVVLMAKDDLLTALDRVRFHIDPDKFIDESIAQMTRDNYFPTGKMIG